jgi:hypothetical protein
MGGLLLGGVLRVVVLGLGTRDWEAVSREARSSALFSLFGTALFSGGFCFWSCEKAWMIILRTIRWSSGYVGSACQGVFGRCLVDTPELWYFS